MKQSDIFRRIPDEENFIFSVLDTIATKLDQQGINLPMDAYSKAYMDIKVPEIIWNFFEKYRTEKNTQEKTAEFCVEFTDFLSGLKKDEPISVAKEKFLETKGYRKIQIRSIPLT